jgi:hypothetical protein
MMVGDREPSMRRHGWLSAADFVGVYLLLLLMIPSRLNVVSLGSVGTPATIWGLLGALWWACATLAEPQRDHRRNPVRVLLWVLALAVVASFVAAMAHGWYVPADIRGLNDDIYDLVPATVADIRSAMISAANRGLVAAVVWIGMSMVIIDGVRSKADLDRVVAWLTGIAAALASIGILQFFTGMSIEGWYQIPGLTASEAFGAVDTRSVVRRVYATAKHPIEYGVIMGAVFPFALHRLVQTPRSMRSRLAAALIGFAVVLSISRSAVLVAGVALLVMFLGWPWRLRIRVLVVAPFAIVAARLAAPGVLGTLRSLFSSTAEDPSVAGRTSDYEIVFRVISEHPVLGRGLFTFVPRYYRILDNQLLAIALELGLVGLVVFVGLVVGAFFSALGARSHTADESTGRLGLAIAAAIAGLAVSHATFDTWGFPMAAGLMFVVIALAGAAWQIVADEEQNSGAGADRRVAKRST